MEEEKKTELENSGDSAIHPAELPLVVRRLTGFGVFLYILHGIGVTLGLTLLWSLEAVRNSFFRLLDRWNLKARVRRASAFPPGPITNRNIVQARR